MASNYAPGMRVVIRNEEWLVKKVDTNSQRGFTLTVTGISQLVKDKEAIFIDNLEEIEQLKPEDTHLSPDLSPYFVKSRLYIESLLRRKVPTDNNRLYIGHKAAMNLLPYQLEPALLALEQPRQRILIADAVGLGKTLEAGILMSELIYRGRGKRILVVTVKSMMTQFQKEMWNRFSIPLVRLDSYGIQKIRSRIPSNHNPFYYFDKAIISMDTLKRDVEYRTYLESAWWDIIVIDEAHNVAERGKSLAQRARLAGLLAERSDTLIMLSATPHDGKPESFASLMNMLDPTAIANERDYNKTDIQGLCMRRFKKDVQDQVEGAFKEHQIIKETCKASVQEEEIIDYFYGITFKSIDQERTAGQLFKTTLKKALFSSPAACLMTIKNRLSKLEKAASFNAAQDVETLETLKRMLERLSAENFSRYQKLLEIIKSKTYQWDYKNTRDRIVIFTERIETMRFLRIHLAKDLGIPETAIAELYGGMSDVEQQRIVDEFGRDESPLRILVASDVASEGINLHYLSHRLIHFDIPWSLMVFQQRNGRIDRYGQEKTPDIRYLVMTSQNELINGDQRILEVLIEKEEQAVKNIGDLAVLMGVYDVEAEERLTAEAIENNDMVGFEKMLAVKEVTPNPLEMMLAAMNRPVPKNTFNTKTTERKTLFNELAYLEEGLGLLVQEQKIQSQRSTLYQGLIIEMNRDLKQHLAEIIPEEAMPVNDELQLSMDKAVIEKEIRKSRQEKMEEKAWSRVQYLWPMHPIVEWLNDKAGSLFPRKHAPLLGLSGVLDKDEVIYIVSGLIPNRRSQPMVNEWLGLCYQNGVFSKVLTMEQVIERTGLVEKRHPNSARITADDCDKYQRLLGDVVHRVRNIMKEKFKAFEAEMNPKLQAELDKLEKLRGKHYEQLQLSLFESKQKSSSSFLERRHEEEKRKIDRIFDEFLDWVEETMTLEQDAYIQVIAVLAEVE